MPKVKNSRIRSGDGFITYKESEPTDVGGLAVEEGMAGKVILQGPPGPPGKPGEPGAPGKPGAPGIGINGDDGESAYDIWLSDGHTGSREDFLNWLRFDGSSYINKSEKAKPNGVATLDSKGKVPLNQLPDEMFGHMAFIGGWDASTNTPPLPDPSIDNKGHYWIVTVEGDIEINGMTDWEIGDWVVSTGTEYIQVDNQNRVSSVNGKRGNVVLTASDIKGTVRSVNNQFPDEDGNVTIPEYVLPIATDTVLGGVKVDPNNSNGILISEDGQISFDSSFNVGFRPAKTWFVATNSQTDGIGSILRPFGTIESAMAVAETNDVIIVYPGVYADTNTVVDKSVAIIGFDGTEIASNLVVKAKNVVLSGFTVDSLQTSGELGKSHFKDLRFSGQKKSNYDLRIGSTNPNDILSFDNIAMTGSKILVEEFAPNVWIKQADTATNTKYEIKGGKTRIIDSKHIDTIDHFEGMLAIENIDSLRLLSSSADDNERLVEDMGKWGLLNHLIIEDVNFEEAIDKTGTCVYTVNLLNRNLRHVLTGDDTNEKKANDLDTRVYYEPINYLNRNIFVNGHLEGLDKAIGLIKDSIAKIVTDIKPADGDGVSLVAHPEGIIKRLKAGANINLLSETNNVTVSLDKNGLITSVNDALPDKDGNVVVPDATNLVKGIVTVKPGGGIKVENGMIEIDEELISSIGFSPANVYFVATNAVKEKSDGTFNRPFTTITEATAKATDKSIIVVETPGVYEENINIDNKGLILLFPKGVTTLIGSVNIKGDKNIIISNLNIDTTGKSFGVKCSNYYGNLKLLDFSINSATTDYPFIIDNGEESLAKGSIEIDNYSISAGRVTAVNYNGSLRFSRQRGRSIAIYEINTGAVFEDIESAQRIDHLSGKMYLRNIKSLGTSAFAPAIASIANDRYYDLLFIDDVNTHVGINLMAVPIHSYVAKSGRCPYVVRMLSRNQEKDVWVGVDLGEKKQTASDSIGMYSPTNYNASPVQTVDLHLKGIDNALKGFVKRLTSTNTAGVSIIKDGDEGILKRIVSGKGISVVSSASDNSLTITNTGVVELTNTPFISGTHSLIRNKTGDLKVFQAGQGIAISEVNGIITIGSGVSSTVASINGRTGHILLVGDGISITSSGQNINLKNLAVMELTNQVGTGRYSLIANKTGHLRTIVGGNGIEIDTSVETLTIRTDPNNTVNSVNGKNGRVVVSAGSGIEIVPTFAGFMVANTGVKTLLGTGVNEAIQLFVRADGVLKGIQPLNGIKINDKENGILEFGIDLNTIETVRTINGAFGNISLEGGSGTIITNPSPGKFVITASGEGGSVTSINNMQGDISFAVDSSMVLVPDETTGKLLMGLNIDELGIKEVTVEEDGDGESIVIDSGISTRKAVLKKIKGDEVSGITVETSDESGVDEIVITSNNIRDVASTTNYFAGSVELISREDYDTDKTIITKKLAAVDGLEIDERNNIITIGIKQGQGFVRSVNGVKPVNPAIGNVEITAKDVEAVSIKGDTIQGNLVFSNQARIKNLLIPVSRDEPVRAADIETLIIDAGMF